MNQMPLDQLTKVIKDAFNGVAKITKSFQTFFIETMILYLSIQKRINFMQMSRFGDSCESRFRQNFQREFDWVGYNSGFTSHMRGHRIALSIDPSYIDKSGRHTPGVGYFWSGCAGAAKYGLEIIDVAVIDADEKDAVHLRAVQTVDIVRQGRPPKYIAGMKNPNSLTAHYLRVLAQERDALLKISNLIVADAFFAKESFVSGVTMLGFHLTSRFRSDVSLKYLYKGPKSGKKGRPKEVDGKVDLKNLRTDYFEEVTYEEGDGKAATLYTAVVRATSMKRDVRVVIVDCMEPGKKTQTRKVFFSTDIDMSAKDIMDIYRTRFQIEFLLRDSKQYTGLTHCQSRQKEALAFHFNMSLTAINVARAFARQDKKNLSVASVKTLIHNAMMIHRFSVLSGKLPNRLLNTNDFKELLYYGVANAA